MSKKSLPIDINAQYQEILRQTQPFLTNRDKTGILDNTQRADQDQEQVGQLTYLIIGLATLSAKIEKLTNTIEAMEQTLKYRPTTQTGTSSGPAQGTAHIGTDFLTYNPPDK